MMNAMKAVRALALAATLLAVPVLVDKPAEALGIDVRPTAACAATTECSFSLFKICVTDNGNERFYRCSKGCEEPAAAAVAPVTSQ